MDKKQLLIIHLIIVLSFSYILFFYGIGDYALKEPDEGRYAEIPREMLELNNYIVPHLNHVRYFEKPPLFYWAVAASYKLFGINEWSFRFVNALSAFLCTLVLYFTSRRWFNERTAILSATILAFSFGFFSMARIVTTDMFFTLWLFASLLCFLGFYKERKAFFIYLFYVFLALATLTKGIVAIILFFITIFIFLIIEKRLAFLKEIRITKGVVIFGMVVLPWFTTISIKESEFFYFFVIDQHFLRFLTSKHKRTGSLFYFFPVLLGGMFPWSIFIPRSIIALWKKSEIRLLIVWSGIVFLFFSISKSKLPPYILPIFPALAMVLGCFFDNIWGRIIQKKLEIIIYAFIFLVFSLTPLTYWHNASIEILSQISKESIDVFQNLKTFVFCISLLSIMFTCFFLFRKSIYYNSVFYLFAFFSLIFVSLLLTTNIKTIDSLNTTKGLAKTINNDIRSDDLLINYGTYDQTLRFYTARPIIIAAYKGELEMGSKYNDAKGIFIDEQEFLKLLKSEKRVFTVLKTKRLMRLHEAIPDNKIIIIDYQGERCLIKNR